MKFIVVFVALALVAAAGLSLFSCLRVVKPTATLSMDALATFDDADFAAVLAEFVDDDGAVDYAGLKASPAALDRFLSRVARQGPASTPALFATAQDATAYYVNAYNAFVLQGVVDRWPITSVNGNLAEGASFFVATRYVVDGVERSLKALEDDVIRTRGEPRVHFALNCASRGCPKLPRTPFRGADLAAQLERETTRFLHESRNVEVTSAGVTLSQIFEWFPRDFRSDGDVVAWLREASPDLDLPAAAKPTFRPWDWRINARVAR